MQKMSPLTATALLLLMVSAAQAEALVLGAPGPPGPGLPGLLEPSKITTPCLTVNRELVLKMPGEPSCLGSIHCEIPKIPPL